MNVLITSTGRRVSLVRYFQNEVKSILGEDVKVFSTDLNPEMSSACLVSDKGFPVGRFADPNYMQQLLEICLDNEVSIVIPTIDPELLLYSKHKETFSNHDISLIVSDEDFVKICRDKHLTNDFLQSRGFKIPKSIDINNPTFPLFIKPINGSSSKNIMLINDSSMLSESIVKNDSFMYMEYLSPKEYEEYTLDLYYDIHSNLKCVVPRIRIETRGGETNKGITRKNELIGFIKKKLSNIEGAIGCLTLQLFYGKENKEIYGIEINPRFGGGYPLSYLAGANYPAWILKEYINKEEIEWWEDWEDNLLLLRHDNEMIVHGFRY